MEGSMFAKFCHRPPGRRLRYPIKRDESGQSARRRAFDAFDEGLKPADVAPMVDISVRTAGRYFEGWKKLPQNFEMRYGLAKMALRTDADFSQKMIGDLVRHWA
jgi:hypothetical protein